MNSSVKYIVTVIAFSMLMQGCSTTVRSSWRDFNAYFNTYYNAKTSFNRGVDLQKNQKSEINPERPIRIHPPPNQAGLNEFEIANKKSADVIRFHPQSRWVDKAIETIGMSYFYQQQFFSADQKFVELLATTPDPELRQRAIYWRGRCALELGNYLEGINYTQSRLFSTEFDWDSEIESEIKLIIAQLYVAREEYEDAEVYLVEAIPGIRDRQLHMRASFLHGQLLEILERYDDALPAYKQVTHRSNTNFDLVYHAELKLGIIARKRGDIDWAFEHFTSMSRDDRHFEYLPNIEYEIARTLQKQRYFALSHDRYNQILQRRGREPLPEVQAKIFYGIAEIYRDYHLDYTMAAAYFDSSSQQVSNPDLLPQNFNASLMARSYGEYSRLQTEIHRLDSLMWLGGLPEDEFNSVIEEIRQQKIEEFEQQEREQRRQQLISVDNIDEAGGQAEENTENGFLNHKNPQLMRQMSQAFQAYWGTRPLVDDWRRMDAVRINIVLQYEEQGETVDDVDEAIKKSVDPETSTLEIDISEIPFTAEEKRETRRRIASHEYEIGNVFYLSLSMPDSAVIYYRNVMGRFPNSEIATQAMYSLSELYQSSGDSVQARQYAYQLVDYFPESIYAEQMAERYNLELNRPLEILSREDSLTLEFQEIKSIGVPEIRADKMRKFADKYPDFKTAPEAVYRSILDYIESARADETYASRLNELATTRYIWEQEKDIRNSFRDSVRSMLADSVYMKSVDDIQEVQKGNSENDTEPTSRSMRQNLQDIAEKTDEEPDFRDLFPYEGELWDSARVALITMQDEYPDFPKISIVNALADEIQAERMHSAGIDPDRLYTCSELDQKPEIAGGFDQFIIESGIRDVLQEHNIDKPIPIQIIIDSEGVPVEVHMNEENYEDDLKKILEAAILKNMRLDSPEFSGVNVRAECEYLLEADFDN